MWYYSSDGSEASRRDYDGGSFDYGLTQRIILQNLFYENYRGVLLGFFEYRACFYRPLSFSRDVMVTEVVKELEAAKAKVAELEQALQKERKQQLAGLPAEYGFDSLEDFIKALKSAGSGRGSAGAGRRGRAPKAAAPSAAPRKKGKRARITPELKDKVKAAVVAGKTGAQIADEFGISVPSVQNIKKEFGLVKTRS